MQSYLYYPLRNFLKIPFLLLCNSILNIHTQSLARDETYSNGSLTKGDIVGITADYADSSKQ